MSEHNGKGNNPNSVTHPEENELLYNLGGFYPESVTYNIPLSKAEDRLEKIAKAAFGQVAEVAFQVIIDENTTTYNKRTKRSEPKAIVVPVVFIDERNPHISAKSTESNIMLGDEQVTDFSPEYKKFVSTYCNIERTKKGKKYTAYEAPIHRDNERYRRGGRRFVAIELDICSLFGAIFDIEGVGFNEATGLKSHRTNVKVQPIWIKPENKERGIRGLRVIKEFETPEDLSSLKGEKLKMNTGRKKHDRDDDEDYKKSRHYSRRDELDDLDFDDDDED